MTESALTLRITTVRSHNPNGFGGCIFTGRPIDDHGDITDAKTLYVVRADHTIINHVSVEVGQWWKVSGKSEERVRVLNGYSFREWQIEATDASMLRPSGEHIVTLLAESDAFVGIGYVKARKLWDAFGEKLYKLLDNSDAEALSKVLTAESAEQVVVAWAQYGDSRSLQWLHKHGFPVSLGRKVLQFFGKQTQEKIEEDPYRLLSFCASWKTVDTFAQSQFNVLCNDARRMQGAVEESLYRIFVAGHTVASMKMLEGHLEALLGKQTPNMQWKYLVSDAVDRGLDNGSYVIGNSGMLHPLGPMVMEMTVARALTDRLAHGPDAKLLNDARLEEVIGSYERVLPFPLTKEQRQAIKLANDHAVALVIGGAGVGKTTVLETLYQIYDATGLRIYQMALAGRAAKRMMEATKRPASTIASFLKNIKPDDLNGPTVVIVDEASMVDVITMSRLCDALPSHVRLVLTGDASQLMPVGPGLILHALVKVAAMPVIELTAVKRFGGGIAKAAQDIRNGKWPALSSAPDDDISFIPCSKAEIPYVVADLHNRDPENIQILTARRNSHDGTKGLNALCQQRYTKAGRHLMVWDVDRDSEAGTGFYLNDLVICTRNRWDLGIQNGSLGRLIKIEDAPQEIKDSNGNLVGTSIASILWDDGECRPVFEELLDDLELGYAITVHKAQGSQWPTIIVPITASKLLDRTLIYTAVTRATTKVIMVGDAAAAKAAVEAPSKAQFRNVALGFILGNMLTGEKQ